MEFDNMEEEKSELKIRGMPGRCYLLMFFNACGFIVAIYFMVQAFKDPQKEELKELNGVVKEWEKNFLDLNESSAFLQSSGEEKVEMFKNFTEYWREQIEDFPKYTPLSFTYHKNISGPLSSFNIIQKNSEEYNITVSFSFSLQSNSSTSLFSLEIPVHMRKIYPANEKVCRNSGKGYWNRSSEKCYFHYNTLEICLLLEENLDLSPQYLQGCNSDSYLKTSAERWQSSQNYSFLNTSIFFQLRSIKDPFVFASYNSLTKLSSSSSTYKSIGLTFLSISLVLALCILAFWLLQRRNGRYLKMQRRDVI